MKPAFLPLVILVFTSLAACDKYRITFNEQDVLTPVALFKDYRLADEGLERCVEQTIKDHSITRPRDLEVLVCSHAGISDLDGLETFSRITRLNLANNELTDVQPLLFLTALATVDLSGNEDLACETAESLSRQVTDKVIVPEHCRAG